MAELLNGNQQWVDSGGKPLLNGKVYIGVQGSDPVTVPKNIFSNRALSSALSNPVTLDSNGFSSTKIWLSDRYSIRVEDSAGVLIKQELDNGELDQAGLTELLTVAGINTVTANGSPTITGYVTNQTYVWVSVSANTGAVTMNIDGLGAKAVTKKGITPLISGDIPASATISMIYDGTRFQIDGLLGNEFDSNNILAAHKNLIIVRASVTTMDIDADDIMLATTTNLSFRAESVNLTVNITASGANGLDTGSEASNTWYHIWVIFNPTTGVVASLLSLSATVPTLPSGFTFKGYVGANFNDGSSDFINITQRGHIVFRTVVLALSNGGATTNTSVTLVTMVPTTALEVIAILRVDDDIANASSSMFIFADAASVWSTAEINNVGQAANDASGFTCKMLVVTSQTIYYRVGTASENGDIDILGWTF